MQKNKYKIGKTHQEKIIIRSHEILEATTKQNLFLSRSHNTELLAEERDRKERSKDWSAAESQARQSRNLLLIHKSSY